MKIRKYYILTDPCRHDPNPGDVLIGKGIQYLISEHAKRQGYFPIFNIINIFEQKDDDWTRCSEDADAVVVCGTPQLGLNNVPKHFDQYFFDNLAKCKKNGCVVANLWTGICDQNSQRTKEQSATLLTGKRKEFLKTNYEVFDLVVARDWITQKVLNGSGVESTQLLDSVSFSPLWYHIEKQKPEYNLFVVRNIAPENERIASIAKMFASSGGNWYFLAHGAKEYFVYKKYFNKNLLMVNNPKSLAEVYSYADKVVSYRVHGSVLASFFGCDLINISMDSRSNILDYFGASNFDIKSFNSSPVKEFKTMSIEKQIKDSYDKFMTLAESVGL